MRVVTDLEECKALWNKYSPNTSLWDDVNVVFSLFDSSKHNAFFIDLEPGLLPLWFDNFKNKYYFFGGSYPEARSLWFDKQKLREIYDFLPANTFLFDIKNSEISDEHFDLVSEEDFRYFVNIVSFNDEQDYFSKLSKKHKKNLKNDISKVMTFNPKISWTNYLNFDALKNFSIARFGEESDFFDEDSQKETLRFIDAVKDYLFCVNVHLDNVLVGLMFCVFYNNVFYVINGSNDSKIKNLGKLLVLESIKKAISLKAVEVNFLVGTTGWKDLWNFEKEKVVTLKKVNS